jgi:hypothetical protein
MLERYVFFPLQRAPQKQEKVLMKLGCVP